MKKVLENKYGIVITKPWSKEMYIHNDKVAEVVKATITEMLNVELEKAKKEYYAEFEDEDFNPVEFEESQYEYEASGPMQEITEAVVNYGFGSGFEIGDILKDVTDTLANSPYYRLAQIAEELDLELKEEFIGVK